MAIKPEKVALALHKISSFLGLLAGMSFVVPQLQAWQGLLVSLTAALGGGGIASDMVEKTSFGKEE